MSELSANSRSWIRRRDPEADQIALEREKTRLEEAAWARARARADRRDSLRESSRSSRVASETNPRVRVLWDAPSSSNEATTRFVLGSMAGEARRARSKRGDARCRPGGVPATIVPTGAVPLPRRPLPVPGTTGLSLSAAPPVVSTRAAASLPRAPGAEPSRPTVAWGAYSLPVGASAPALLAPLPAAPADVVTATAWPPPATAVAPAPRVRWWLAAIVAALASSAIMLALLGGIEAERTATILRLEGERQAAVAALRREAEGRVRLEREVAALRAAAAVVRSAPPLARGMSANRRLAHARVASGGRAHARAPSRPVPVRSGFEL